MIKKSIIKENAYYDSVTLMLISSEVSNMDGVQNAAAMMGTDQNKDLMYASGLIDDKDLEKITSNHMVIGVLAESEEIIDTVVEKIMTSLEQKKSSAAGSGLIKTRTANSAVEKLGNANMAIISVPGRFAKAEAMRAMNLGLNVLLFSDNVSLEEEIELKKVATEKQLLMMGPDCGSAIINDVSLGFTNKVAKGDVGIVAAAGTGLQEATVVVDRNGAGISQAIGTGGRDLKKEVGGMMMLMGIDALIEDDNTKVILIVSKPADKEVMQKMVDKLMTTDKPKVMCILGGEGETDAENGLYFTTTLEDASVIAAQLSKGQEIKTSYLGMEKREVEKLVAEEVSKLADNQKYLRGLYSGGTLTYESMLGVKEIIGETFSNISSKPELMLENIHESKEHTIVDMGDDEFTNGRPHPMIDTRLRVERIAKEANDADTAVILLDCVIGFGSNPDPAGDLAGAIKKVREAHAKEGRYVSFVASICGTDKDPQNRLKQEEKLRDAGVIVMESNIQAARVAALIVNRGTMLESLSWEVN